jgi:isochorismate hydrolase
LADPEVEVRRAAVAAFSAHPHEVGLSLIALQEAAIAETDEVARASLRALLAPK